MPHSHASVRIDAPFLGFPPGWLRVVWAAHALHRPMPRARMTADPPGLFLSCLLRIEAAESQHPDLARRGAPFTRREMLRIMASTAWTIPMYLSGLASSCGRHSIVCVPSASVLAGATCAWTALTKGFWTRPSVSRTLTDRGAPVRPSWGKGMTPDLMP